MQKKVEFCIFVLMIHTKLINNNGFQWFSEAGISVKGFLYDQNNRLLKNEKLAQYFNSETKQVLTTKLQQANGLFAVVIQTADFEAFAVDRTRTFPLFYTTTKQEVQVADDSNELLKFLSHKQIDTFSRAEFMATAYITGQNTLFAGIKQVRAGELIIINEMEIVCETYFQYLNNQDIENEKTDYKPKFCNTINQVGQRLKLSIANRPVAVPLSGGLDSRLVALLLKQNGIENVLCFTYGRKNNAEAQVAEQVAARLGYKWIFIEYNQALINNYLNDSVFREYFLYSAQNASMFFMQDYFAVKYLYDKQLIPQDTVFIPGHTGDVLSGGHLTQGIDFYEQSTVQAIYNKHYTVTTLDATTQAIVLNRIKSYVDSYREMRYWGYSIFENWGMKERQAKFIVNSTNVFPFFGYQFLLPLWDNSLIEFFRTLPFVLKQNSTFYREILIEKYFRTNNIVFNHDFRTYNTNSPTVKLRQFVKHLLPRNIVYHLRKDKTSHFPIYYKEITKYMRNELIQNKIIIHEPYNTNFNSIIVQWYLYQIDKRLASTKTFV